MAHGATLIALGRFAWSGTLWIGVALAAALFGGLVGWLVEVAPRPARERR